MSGVWREVTGPDSYEVHIADLDGEGIVTVVSAREAASIADDFHKLADDLLAAAAEPDNCTRCRNAYTDQADGLCFSCREVMDGVGRIVPLGGVG